MTAESGLNYMPGSEDDSVPPKPSADVSENILVALSLLIALTGIRSR